MTLTEVLVTSALLVAATMVFVVTDVGRFRVQEDLRVRATNQVGQSLLGLTAYRMARNLEQADRIVIYDSGIDLVNPDPDAVNGDGNIKVRFPPTCLSPVDPACLNIPANYTWGEYRLNGNQLQFLSGGGGCANTEALANGVSALTFRYRASNPANLPPGGEPFAPTGTGQNNVVDYSLTWTGGGRTYRLQGTVTSRAIAYTNVNASLTAASGDSGSGLAPAGPPPAACL